MKRKNRSKKPSVKIEKIDNVELLCRLLEEMSNDEMDYIISLLRSGICSASVVKEMQGFGVEEWKSEVLRQLLVECSDGLELVTEVMEIGEVEGADGPSLARFVRGCRKEVKQMFPKVRGKR